MIDVTWLILFVEKDADILAQYFPGLTRRPKRGRTAAEVTKNVEKVCHPFVANEKSLQIPCGLYAPNGKKKLVEIVIFETSLRIL